MKEVVTKISIQAPINLVWETLTNSRGFRQWNPILYALTGTMQPRAKGKVVISIDGKHKIALPIIYRIVDPPYELVWTKRLLFNSLLKTTHYFSLTSIDDNVTQLTHGERFEGALVPLLWKKIESQLTCAYKTLNHALKLQCEKKAAVNVIQDT